MENTKVKMELINEDGKVIGTSTVATKDIDTLFQFHGISALDEAYDRLVAEIKE